MKTGFVFKAYTLALNDPCALIATGRNMFWIRYLYLIIKETIHWFGYTLDTFWFLPIQRDRYIANIVSIFLTVLLFRTYPEKIEFDDLRKKMFCFFCVRVGFEKYSIIKYKILNVHKSRISIFAFIAFI